MTTELRSTPIGAISISTTSCSRSVKSSGVRCLCRQQHGPCGNDCDLQRYPVSPRTAPMPRRVSPANTDAPPGAICCGPSTLSRRLLLYRGGSRDPARTSDRDPACADTGGSRLDVARAHVVAYRASDMRPRGVDHQRKLGLSTLHCVAPNAHTPLRSSTTFSAP